MVFQQGALFEWLPVSKNVDFGLRMKKTDKKESNDLVEKWLDIVGLQGFGDTPTYQLSGGMQQRASLCRALIHEPDLLLLDEPFAALDAFTREDLWGLVQSIWRERRPTTVLVTHDLREAVYLADTVYVFSKGPGRIVHREDIDLPRPRTVDGTFDPAFVEYVQRLRGHIVQVRETGTDKAAVDKESAHG